VTILLPVYLEVTHSVLVPAECLIDREICEEERPLTLHILKPLQLPGFIVQPVRVFQRCLIPVSQEPAAPIPPLHMNSGSRVVSNTMATSFGNDVLC